MIFSNSPESSIASQNFAKFSTSLTLFSPLRRILRLFRVKKDDLHTLRPRQALLSLLRRELTVCAGCGTMGISILSGVLDSLNSATSSSYTSPRMKPSASGTSTPAAEVETSSLPSRFIACVSREESVRNLKKTFKDERVEIRKADNFSAVKESDVILLWSVSFSFRSQS